MDELIKSIREMPLNDFGQQLHIHLSTLKGGTDPLKNVIALLLLAQESLDIIKEMDTKNIISQLRKKVEETAEEQHRYKEALQMQLSENGNISNYLLEGKPMSDYQSLQEKIDTLLRQQEQILRQAIDERAQISFESIAIKI